MTAFVVKLAFEALVLVIIAGIVLTMVCQLSRARWTRHLALRAVMAAAFFLCTPVRLLMKSFGIPVAPVDFSPLLTVLALRAIQGLVVGLLGQLRFLP